MLYTAMSSLTFPRIHKWFLRSMLSTRESGGMTLRSVQGHAATSHCEFMTAGDAVVAFLKHILFSISISKVTFLMFYHFTSSFF